MVLFRLVALTTACMAGAWYFLSGGADFRPGNQGVTVFAAVPDVAPPRSGPVASAGGDSASTRAQEAGQPDATTSGAPMVVKASFVQARPELDAESKERLASLFEKSVATRPQAQDRSAVFQVVSADKGGEAPVAANPVEYRKVSGSRVNMRSGPGTSFAVVDTLSKGAEVEVLDENGRGWVKLRTLNGSQIGWMSGNFLVASN